MQFNISTLLLLATAIFSVHTSPLAPQSLSLTERAESLSLPKRAEGLQTREPEPKRFRKLRKHRKHKSDDDDDDNDDRKESNRRRLLGFPA
ncbi:uncharacterized protein L3040_004128 [Drepanopeziza brunnea f. sp. 'multigermtubi']|uniref:uncharacterized protein n=1 Tax=Drepanopeziza brunnea f. sp. 'multigermtubi' TaxID=698441 RepID=UPI0023897D30|nr:hypothetical protein L3040_004128 [Drepanopeziza brunnea f. sp. 'multigermtubi']